MSDRKWVIAGDGAEVDIHDAEHLYCVAERVERSDAEQIVRAVRSYDAMRGVCEHVVARRSYLWGVATAVVAAARAALAKTKEDVTK